MAQLLVQVVAVNALAAGARSAWRIAESLGAGRCLEARGEIARVQRRGRGCQRTVATEKEKTGGRH